MRQRSSASSVLACLLSLALALPQGALAAQTSAATQKKAPTTTPAAQPAGTAAPPAAQADADPPAGTNADPGWPRTIELKTGTAVWYQPQIESWPGQSRIVAWSAVSYLPTGAKEPALGTIKIEGPTSVSVDERVVSMDLRITEYNFKTLSPDQVKALVAEVQDRPLNERVIDLDRVLAYVSASPLQARSTTDLKFDPPTIFSAPAPAMLINLDGDAIWSAIDGTDLRYAVNTNWDLFDYAPTKTFYLRRNQSWLQAPAVTGPWTAVKEKLPESFSKIPLNENWKDVRDALPGKKLSGKETPKVFVSTVPAELIELNGKLSYLKVTGAQTLLWVNNTEADLFRMGLEGDFYYLVAGRWFKASSLEGPWTFATPSLPPDFKLIPVEHPRSRVLASVPGTRQATEAVLLASIPRTARVNKKQLKAPDVIYQGDPQFKPIEGAQGGVQQAVNTDKDIVKFGDLYYMCFQGVWFMARAATGPWEVASSVPKEIYTIPVSSSINHVTYVTVVEEDNDDEWVTFAYVAAYTGLMIGFGCAMWGSGWYYPPYYGFGGYYPYPHTYGMGAWYNPYTGAYGRGYAAYGPYGGVGMGSAYNPRTGTYARGATAYGPYGSRSAAQAYNPRTGTYAQTRQGSNVYGNWGSSSVQRGDSWAQTAHKTNYQTGQTTSGIRTSNGGGAVNRTGPGGSTTVGRTGSGDIYAGHDGNVYRQNGSGGWEQNNGSGGWNPVDSPSRPSPSGQAGTNARGTGTGATAGTTGAGAGTTGTGAATRVGTSAGTGAGVGTGAGAGQVNQLEADRGARTSGNQRTSDRSSWESSGSSRSGAGSYGGSRSSGGARAGGGGGRRR